MFFIFSVTGNFFHIIFWYRYRYQVPYLYPIIILPGYGYLPNGGSHVLLLITANFLVFFIIIK